jgi:hypothetical protein
VGTEALASDGKVVYITCRGRAMSPGRLRDLNAAAPHIEVLDLIDTNLNDADLGALSEFKHLEDINLMDNDISADGFVRLTKVPRLKRVYLSSRQVPLEGLDSLGATCPQIKWIVDFGIPQ